MEDCREVLLAYKKSLAEAKAKKEAEAKKSMVRPVNTIGRNNVLISLTEIAVRECNIYITKAVI